MSGFLFSAPPPLAPAPPTSATPRTGAPSPSAAIRPSRCAHDREQPRQTRSETMIAIVSPVPYLVITLAAGVVCAWLCVAARRHPGRWAIETARVTGVVLAVDAAVWWLVVL